MIVPVSTGEPVFHISIMVAFRAPGCCATVCDMTLVRQAVGAYGERRAVQHLVAAGLRIVDRNWRCPQGEIDIVAWDGDVIVFCEVKTRRGAAYGPPAEAVVRSKARRLRQLAARWLVATGAHPREVRFDVVSVLPQRRGPARIDHIRGAF